MSMQTVLNTEVYKLQISHFLQRLYDRGRSFFCL